MAPLAARRRWRAGVASTRSPRRPVARLLRSWPRRPGRVDTALHLTLLGSTEYCDNVKNITVTVDDDTYRLARVKAAERDTSVSALVKQYLADLAQDEGAFERLAQEEQALRERIRSFRAGDRISRDELYDHRR
jgi:hypothetical protein